MIISSDITRYSYAPSLYIMYNNIGSLIRQRSWVSSVVVVPAFGNWFQYKCSTRLMLYACSNDNMVQLNSNLTLVFDYLWVFTDFIWVPGHWSHAFVSNSCSVTNLTREWWNWLLHESWYESPYEFHGGSTSTSLDSWNMWFPSKSFSHGYNHK